MDRWQGIMDIFQPKKCDESSQSAAKEAKERIWELAIQVPSIGVPDKMSG